jgi:hypothetical protein
MSTPDDFRAAHSRYQGYRDAAFHLTWGCMAPRVANCDLRIMPFDDDALAFWSAIRHFGASHPSGGFSWGAIYAQYRSNPRRFDVAIWDGDVLCGLAAGKPSRGDENVTLNWIERFPTAHNTTKGWVMTIALTAADHYARILGKRYLMVRNPLPGTESLYAEHQFELAGRRFGATYWSRPVA